ncbi:MAG: hypothetical protein ACJ75G_03815 [Gaiellaceae bacterium]
MFSRRFVLLVGVLVALNVALWFAAPGLALRKAVIQELFGSQMIRAEVYEKHGSDWRLDRGVIMNVSSSQLTLREADGRIQAIPISGSTRVIRLGLRLPRSDLAPHWHVLVTWPAPNGPAQSVDVERIPPARVK